MHDALIIDAVRSPIGKKNGSLASIRGDELAAQVLNGLVARHDLDPGAIEDVQLGCVTQIGEQGWNLGRMVPLVAGWPDTVCGTTVDRQCGSSTQCALNAAAAVWSGQLDLVAGSPGGGVAVRRTVAVDETPRRDTSPEKLAALTPAFVADGVVTAGNSSQIVDGAAAVLVASAERAAALDLEPRARFVSFG